MACTVCRLEMVMIGDGCLSGRYAGGAVVPVKWSLNLLVVVIKLMLISILVVAVVISMMMLMVKVRLAGTEGTYST